MKESINKGHKHQQIYNKRIIVGCKDEGKTEQKDSYTGHYCYLSS